MTDAEWKGKEPTEKQINAIRNMSLALGGDGEELPKSRGEASARISELKEIIHNNLSIGGSINVRHSIYFKDYGLGEDNWSDFGNN